VFRKCETLSSISNTTKTQYKTNKQTKPLSLATITIQNLEKSKRFGEPFRRTKIIQTEEEIIKPVSKHKKCSFFWG
jgi:hypothetical protein